MRPSIPPIKPCPFCGASRLEGSLLAHQVCANVPYRWPHEVEDPWEPTLSISCDSSGYYWVSCTGSKGIVSCCTGPTIKGPANPSTGRNPDKVGQACAKAVEAWNQRVSGQQMRMELT